MSSLRNSVVFAFLAAAFAVSLLAQSNLSQQISGVVTDPTGAVLPNATVIVVDQGTGLTRTVKTGGAGEYTVPDLPTGTYRLTCEAPGFKKEVVDSNQLLTNVSIEVNFKLQVGSQSDSVTVQADAAMVESSNGDYGQTVTGDQAGELQLNGRNFPELLQLLPGVSTNYTDGFSLFGGYGVNNSGQSINGGRTDTTTWNLDGGDNKDNGGGGNNFINVNPNAIGEFRVLSSNYSAESGTSSGAVVNIAIKSGTKNFHGMLYEYWRNDHLQAYTYNAATVGKPKLRWNNFGGNVGGPVIVPKTRVNKDRNQLFFFFSEDLKYLRQGATTTWTVPTAAVKSGNLGTSTITDPDAPLVNGKQVQFPSNVIPISRIDQNMQKLVNIYPAANSGTASFVFNETTPTNVHQEIVKLDYNLNEKNQLSFHWGHDHYNQLENTTNLIEYYRQLPGQNTSLQWNHVFAPTLINVAQFTYTGNVITEESDVVPNTTFIKSYTRSGFGITLPTIFNASQDIPQVAISGYTTLSVSALNFNNFNRVFDWKDTLTRVMGSHTVKAGILVMRSRKNQDNPPQINGVFNFATSRSPTTGQAMADALIGDFQQYQEYSGVRQGWYRFWQVEPYLQDDWKVNARLTVNFGVRWSYMQPQYSALNNTVQFLPQYFNPALAATVSPTNGQVIAAPSPYNGLVLTGPGFPATAKGRVAQYSDPATLALFHNLPLGGANTRWGNYAPRFGFAYDLTGHQNTVLRGGFGVAYERIEGNFIFSGINNAPFNAVDTILNGNVETPNQGAVGPASVQTINNSHFLDMKDPRTLTWSLGIQQKIGTGSILSISYVGSSAANLSYIDDINQSKLGTTYVDLPGTTTLVNSNALRPYQGYAAIQEYVTGANFIYNSLQMQFRKSLGHAGIISSAFTYASSRTDANAYNYQPEDSYNLRGDWGQSSYGRREVWTSSYVYPLPWWRGGGSWYKQAFGGWQFNGTGLVQSGLPINITDSNTSYPGTGTDVGSGLRPNLIGNPYNGGNVGGYQVLNPQAFANPAINTFGNLGAYAIYLPRWINLNGSFVKSFYTNHERLKWDFKFDMYNVANHLSISGVNTGSFNGTKVVNGVTVSNTANWGSESGTTPPRTMEASLRLNF
jgi:hypothetical protein